MNPPLVGYTILVVENEPQVALAVMHGLETAGARVLLARTLEYALLKVEEPVLSAAVLNQGLSEEDTSEVCAKLNERDIPFVIYSGCGKIDGACNEGELVKKPASPQALVIAVADLLRDRQVPQRAT